MTTVTIAGIPIGDGHPCRLVADIGTNHGGNLDLAMVMIGGAKDAGCDFVKGQCRTAELAVPQAEWNELRDTPWGRMPKLLYRQRVEFNHEEWAQLFWFAASIGIPLFTSVWDMPSLESMEQLGSPCHKIPSARWHDEILLKAACETTKPLILSTGMADWHDVRRTVDLISYYRLGEPGNRNLVILQCTSAYPSKAEECNLRVIQKYREAFGCPVGFSSHKIGIATAVLAVAVGANMIERHITLSRDMKGSDHRMSSEPEDLARLVREIRYAEACLGSGEKVVFPSEEAERKRLRGQK